MGLPVFKNDVAPWVSSEDYLRQEREAEHKHEYYNGEICAMAGAGYMHNLSCVSLTAEIHGQLRGKGCSGVGSNQCIQILIDSRLSCPGLTVVCSKPKSNEEKRPDPLLTPRLPIGVLSPSSGQHGRSDKFMLYRQVESLQQYLMTDPASLHAELYTRDDRSRWIFTKTRYPTAVLDLGSIDCQVPLAEVSAEVKFCA